MPTRPTKALWLAQWHVLDRSGWELLLPDGTGRRWLCVEALDGATSAMLSTLCADVHVVAADGQQGRRLVALMDQLELRNILPLSELPTGDIAPAERYDGLVLYDPCGVVRESQRLEIAGRADNLVKDDGFVFIAAPNRYSYFRLRRSSRQIAHFGSARSVRRRLAGWRCESIPLICDEGQRLVEVVPPTGYVSAKNPHLASERLRRLLIGPMLARITCPVVAVFGRKPSTPPCLINRLLDDARAHGIVDDKATLLRYHVLRGGKAVLSFGPPRRGYGTVVAIVARGGQAIDRRDREMRALQMLASELGKIANLIPKVHYRSTATNRPAYLLQEMPGVSIDAAGPLLDCATKAGVAFIERLHAESQRQVEFDQQHFTDICEPILGEAESRYPPLADSLAGIRRIVRTLVGKHLPLVWMHGDFKAENLIIDPTDCSLTGVIDWEHAARPGLPMLDLWYLLLYSECIRRSRDFFAEVRELTRGRGFANSIAGTCDAYAKRVGIPDEARLGLAAAFLVHHVGTRIQYDPSDTTVMGAIAEALDDLAAGQGSQ